MRIDTCDMCQFFKSEFEMSPIGTEQLDDDD